MTLPSTVAKQHRYNGEHDREIYREYILLYDKYFPKLSLQVKYIFSTYTYMFWSLEWLFYALSPFIEHL